LAKGLKDFSGTAFDVRGLSSYPVRSWKNRLAVEHYPHWVAGIPVGLTFHTCCCLQGASGTEGLGTQIGSYILHYADGQKHEIPIRYGDHLSNGRVANGR